MIIPKRQSSLYSPLPFRNTVHYLNVGLYIDRRRIYKTDGTQKTDVYGVFACGDNASRMTVGNYQSALLPE